jgi:PPM family protein phosphatase
MTLTLRFAARSHRGLIREGNQDSVYAGPRLLAVADGMGGMAAGDVASNLAIAAMAPLDEDVPPDSLVDALRGAVELANQNLRDAVDANPAMEGMGTTLTGMLFSGTTFGMVHVGDSRCYLLRGGEFSQITKDDTYVQMLVDEGRITEEEASVHPQRSLLIRALQGSDVDPQYSVRAAVVGDRYLLCSDGLSGPVSDDSIAEAMRQYPDPDECAERLLQLALRGGGPDNITVIIADVTDEDIIEGRPIVGGAASRYRAGKDRDGESTPAARASALTPAEGAGGPDGANGAGRDDDEESPDDDPKRHSVRTALLLAAVLVLLVGGLFYGYRYTQTQYYVGVTADDHVAIFQGVKGKVVGLALNKVYTPSTLAVTDLSSAAQNEVRQTIPARNLDDAQKILAGLGTAPNIKPLCVDVVAPSTPPAPTPTLSPSVPAIMPSGERTPSEPAHPSSPSHAGKATTAPRPSTAPSLSPHPSTNPPPSAVESPLPSTLPTPSSPTPSSTDCR